MGECKTGILKTFACAGILILSTRCPLINGQWKTKPTRGRDRFAQGPLVESGLKFGSASRRLFLSSNSHLNALRIHQLEQEKFSVSLLVPHSFKGHLPCNASLSASMSRKISSIATFAPPRFGNALPTPLRVLRNSWPGLGLSPPNASSSSRPVLTK